MNIVNYHEIGSSQIFEQSRIYTLFSGDSKATHRRFGLPWHLNYSYWKSSASKLAQARRVCPHYEDGSTLDWCLRRHFGNCSI
jgi:hypothetical protein